MSDSATIDNVPSSQRATDSLIRAKDMKCVNSLGEWLENRLPNKSDLQRWGQSPESKTVGNLWLEIEEGESFLVPSSPPVRIVNVVCIKIVNERGQMLVESHQEMGNGSLRSRNRPLSEKVKQGETVKQACLRGIREELGPSLGAPENVTLFPETYVRVVEERDSGSYPGLRSQYYVHTVSGSIHGLPRGSFCTEENEHQDGICGSLHSQLSLVGVRKHFWAWRDGS